MVIFTEREFMEMNTEHELLFMVKKQDPKKFYIQGMQLDRFVPHYYLYSQRRYENGTVRYHYRCTDRRTLFIYTLYESLYHFMTQLGYNPTEHFEHHEIEAVFRNEERVYNSYKKLYPRLIIHQSHPYYEKGQYLRVLSVKANFLSNDREKNYGFRLILYPNHVDVYKMPYVRFVDTKKRPLNPTTFLREFLLMINYPYHLYKMQQKRGTLGRLIDGYRMLSQKRGKYKPWSFNIHEEIL